MISKDFFGLDKSQVWDMEMAFRRLKSAGQANTKRTAERRLREWCFFPKELRPENLLNEQDRSIIGSLCNFELEKARSKRKLILFAQLAPLPSNKPCLHANDARGGRYWVPLEKETIDVEQIAGALSKLQKHLAKSVALFPHGALVLLIRRLPVMPSLTFCLLGYPPNLDLNNQRGKKKPSKPPRHFPPTHMDRLEAESIFIFREAVAGAENPVMLYSSGKDSSVMLHLARKAFFPSRPNFPLLHVDTRWKFQEMYLFRDAMALESGMKLLVHINPEAIEKNINPFDHGSALHTSITKTEGLKQVLDKNGFDVVFGGARRDEEMSRAKERIFSLRSAAHRWDPKNQRPELWNLYNTTKQKGETLRVFPLSNWTELDIWEYIYRENIPVVPLYFAKERPVVIRDGLILMVDDDRMRLLPREKIELRKVRFRTLGCYPLSGAIESQAETVPEIIMEILASSTSERQGRLIDTDTSGSMERKKHEGYF